MCCVWMGVFIIGVSYKHKLKGPEGQPWIDKAPCVTCMKWPYHHICKEKSVCWISAKSVPHTGLEFWRESKSPLSQRLLPNLSARIKLDSRKLSKVSHKLNGRESKDPNKLHPGESKWTLEALYIWNSTPALLQHYSFLHALTLWTQDCIYWDFDPNLELFAFQSLFSNIPTCLIPCLRLSIPQSQTTITVRSSATTCRSLLFITWYVPKITILFKRKK